MCWGHQENRVAERMSMGWRCRAMQSAAWSVFERLDGGEVPIGQCSIGERPQALGRLEYRG